MRISGFPCVIASVVSLMIGYLAFHVAQTNNDGNFVMVGIGTFISIFTCIIGLLAVKHEDSRLETNIRAWSTFVLILLLVVNFAFAIFGVNMPFYLSSVVIATAIHIFVLWKLSEANN